MEAKPWNAALPEISDADLLALDKFLSQEEIGKRCTPSVSQPRVGKRLKDARKRSAQITPLPESQDRVGAPLNHRERLAKFQEIVSDSIRKEGLSAADTERLLNAGKKLTEMEVAAEDLIPSASLVGSLQEFTKGISDGLSQSKRLELATKWGMDPQVVDYDLRVVLSQILERVGDIADEKWR